MKDKILEEFYTYAVAHGNAIDSGDYKKANKLHGKLYDLYNQAKEFEIPDVFLEALNDSNDSIKLWAATFTLKVNSEKAVAVLQEVAQSKQIIGMTAKTTLTLWKQNKLDLI